jgi:hypothetical protein
MNLRRRAEPSQSEGGGALPSERDVLLAILAILIDEREARAADRPKQSKTELLLADAGLPFGTIAILLNKQPDAVRMSIARARTREPKGSVSARGIASGTPSPSRRPRPAATKRRSDA